MILVRQLPTPSAWALWFVVAVPMPLLVNAATHPLETFPHAHELFLWTVVSLPVLAALVRARSWPGALVAGAVTGALALLIIIGLSRWVAPLDQQAGFRVYAALPLALLGAAAGHGLRRLFHGPAGPPRRWRYVAGGVLALLGMIVVPSVIEIAARNSTDSPAGAPAPPSGTLAAGRWAVHRHDAAEGGAAGCEIDGRAVGTLAVPVDYSIDATADVWVGTVTIDTPGEYDLSCPFDFSARPVDTRGAVSFLVSWPLLLLWLLGATPGLVVLGETYARQRRSQ
ncbi:hypothetical protein [Symbioplanes lichenis]|uniref:hypothetical protein n=1 Tax=Symbioplanes lichenis TaxID=1629072 RepID=UPI002739C154|nr:hypothetical protein [Actinoplanes lichenis]